ncbi:MAG: carbohydrate binding family 9 domain-containing protein, partial [Opitutales bacterium]|nr:carbohydrate binding family 9 domain-containing protein [Opitutales bacterium]
MNTLFPDFRVINWQSIARVLSVLLFCYPGLWGQPPDASTRKIEVTLINEQISINGVLDEVAWRSAPTIGNLIQREPDTGQAPSEKTEIKILRDENNLYVGVVAFDTDPEKIVGNNMTRDASTRSQDIIQFILDTFKDRRNAYYFATNPSGALIDGLVFGDLNLNTDWNSIWDLRTVRSKTGWV